MPVIAPGVSELEQVPLQLGALVAQRGDSLAQLADALGRHTQQTHTTRLKSDSLKKHANTPEKKMATKTACLQKQIKALELENQKYEKEIEKLKSDNQAIKAQLAALQAILVEEEEDQTALSC